MLNKLGALMVIASFLIFLIGTVYGVATSRNAENLTSMATLMISGLALCGLGNLLLTLGQLPISHERILIPKIPKPDRTS